MLFTYHIIYNIVLYKILLYKKFQKYTTNYY